ncbi:hypothetical protein TGDOM2_309095 [Toxoplasma gondii GAB2-2007-GAL-DOM2]|uniref:Uncharacterized protein n=5 Tax=Toxoplasma gondii TaxID=5811 RepID=A0A086LGB0_TOXGO|nr:hypothetical protein TGDOM2_309095 [Toxoplasma gondii GAB2-2007-GAL-DOM2]KFG55678.1 hypothetical protein TGFOU_309095 [Toxoplasma gondii FOU]KYF47418.1 hypothetical protein TGARI_309095 [Toxoplasma gondii ARI]PUA92043.1 hypothetical protein TGBR9_309095 [Toxoplasma gondii TgCATBr9]RQX72281.1 hypothetical protein TGCAST_309095 [Toxoplasma gondii CAST]
MQGFCLSPQKNKTSVTSLLQRISDAHARAPRPAPEERLGPESMKTSVHLLRFNCAHMQEIAHRRMEIFTFLVRVQRFMSLLHSKKTLGRHTPSATSPRGLPTAHCTPWPVSSKASLQTYPTPSLPCSISPLQKLLWKIRLP